MSTQSKLVPAEPTEEMLRAAVKAFQQSWSEDDPLADYRRSYRAMLAASPNLGGEGGEREAMQQAVEALERSLSWLTSYPGSGPMNSYTKAPSCYDQSRAAIESLRAALSRTGEAAQGDALDARWQPIETLRMACRWVVLWRRAGTKPTLEYTGSRPHDFAMDGYICWMPVPHAFIDAAMSTASGLPASAS